MRHAEADGADPGAERAESVEPDLIEAIDATEQFVEGRGYVSEDLAIDLVESLRVPAAGEPREGAILSLIEEDVEDLAGRDVVPSREVTDRLEELRHAAAD